MRAFWIVLHKDLLRKVRSPLSTVAMLLFPIVFSMLIGVTFGSRGEKVAAIRVALVDEDKGLAAQLLRSSFGQEKMRPRIEAVVVDSAKGMRLVEADKVSALIRIPRGFTDSLMSGGPTFLEVVKNPAQRVYPRVVEEFVRGLAQIGGSAVRVLEGPLRDIRGATRADAPPADEFVSRVSLQMSHTFQGVGRYALPPAIRVEETAGGGGTRDDKGDSPFRVALFVLPGMAVFALLMLGMVHMADFQRERALGTLARQIQAPVPAMAVVVGKIAATWSISLVSILVLALLATLWAGAGVSLSGFVGLSLVTALAATGFAAFVQSLTRSERTGSAIGSILVMLMSMAGGSFIPLESMSGLLLKVAPFTLTYWATQGYKQLLFQGAGIGSLGPNLAVLGGLGILFSLTAVVLFRRRLAGGA